MKPMSVNKTIWLILSLAIIMISPQAKAADGIPCNCENQLKDIERQIESAKDLFDKLQTEVNALRGNPSIPALNCSDVAQNATIGTVCKTSAQISFKREADGWRDLGPNGKFWLNKIKTYVSFQDAILFCNEQQMGLPTGYPPSSNGTNGFPNQDSDFATAYSHGILEVFKDMADSLLDLNFWSSSLEPNDKYGVFVFIGTDKNVPILVTSKMNYNDTSSVRCVSHR